MVVPAMFMVLPLTPISVHCASGFASCPRLCPLCSWCCFLSIDALTKFVVFLIDGYAIYVCNFPYSWLCPVSLQFSLSMVVPPMFIAFLIHGCPPNVHSFSYPWLSPIHVAFLIYGCARLCSWSCFLSIFSLSMVVPPMFVVFLLHGCARLCSWSCFLLMIVPPYPRSFSPYPWLCPLCSWLCSWFLLRINSCAPYTCSFPYWWLCPLCSWLCSWFLLRNIKEPPHEVSLERAGHYDHTHHY